MGSIPVHVPFLNRHEARKTIIRYPICRSLALANRIVFARRRRGSHRSEVQNNIICGIDAGNVHRCSMHSTVAEACVLHASWAQLLIDRSTAVHNTTITRARPCPRGTPNSDDFFYPRASSGSHLIASFAQHGWLARVICNYSTLQYSSRQLVSLGCSCSDVSPVSVAPRHFKRDLLGPVFRLVGVPGGMASMPSLARCTVQRPPYAPGTGPSSVIFFVVERIVTLMVLLYTLI